MFARRRLLALVVSLSSLLWVSATAAYAAGPGALLNKVVTPFQLRGNAVIVDRQSRTIIAGETLGPRGTAGGRAVLVTRYTADDQLDTSSGDNGRFILDLGTDAFVNAIAIDAHDRIVLAGANNKVLGQAL
jgi:hypothetical protein